MAKNYTFFTKKHSKSLVATPSNNQIYCTTIEKNSIAYNTEKNKHCLIVQNNVKLNQSLPYELQNLQYGIYSTNISYYLLRLVYNREINYFPQAIFYPSTYEEIQFLIKTLYIYRYSIDFTIRCGGHAYEPASVSNGVIIDVSRLNNITMKNNNIINSQSGIKLGALMDYMQETRRVVPTGHNVCVGLSGLSLGGGKGELSRMFGLTCDNILSCKMVDYKGEILTINENENSDLLYGLRGAGTNNFGLVLEIDLQSYPDVYYIQEIIQWDWDKDVCLQVLKEYITTINNNQDNSVIYQFHMQSNEYSNQVNDFKVKVTKFYNSPNSNNIIQEADNFKKYNNNNISIEKGYYTQNLSWADYGNGLQAPFSKIKSSMLFNNINYTDAQLNILISSIDYMVKNSENVDYQLNFSELNGQVASNSSINSCFYPRDATCVLSYFIQWPTQEDSDRFKSFMTQVWTNFKPYASSYCLTNIIDYDIDDYMTSYYGTNQDQLKTIKEKYDPTNFFKWRQSIPLPN